MDGIRQSVTAVLEEWAQGDFSARERLVPIVYEEVKRLAGGFLRREPAGHSLQSGELAHEALIRLLDQRNAPAGGRERLMALVAELMRRVLVDHARKKRAMRRGGGAAAVTLDENIGGAAELDVIDVHLALSKLAELDPRQAEVVELRVFGGYEVAEIARILEVSTATVKRGWRTAKVWLARELRG